MYVYMYICVYTKVGAIFEKSGPETCSSKGVVSNRQLTHNVSRHIWLSFLSLTRSGLDTLASGWPMAG